MVQTERYQQIILDLLKDYASVKSPFWPDVENQVIANSQNQHYQLVRIGWDENNNFVHYIVFHFDLIKNKVWIQANNTDRKIADELIQMGGK